MARPPAQYVEAPQGTPLPFGLFSAALVTDDLTTHNRHGVNYQPVECGPAYLDRASCDAAPSMGDLSLSVDNAREATITATGHPAADFLISWGDDDTTGTPDLDTTAHTYAADGDYDVTVRDTNGLGYFAAATVTVTNGVTSGPYDANPGFARVVTDGLSDVLGEPFTVYSILRCAPIGLDVTARVEANLRAGEQRAVERHLADLLAADTAAVLVRDGAAVTPKEGVSILEQWSAANYGSVPTFHMPRGVASLLGFDQTMIGGSGRLVTSLGSFVAAGAGYAGLNGPTGEAPAADEAWIYVTGGVTVRRTPALDVIPVQMTRSPDATNDAMAVAERPYVVSYECIVGAVKVSAKSGQVGAYGGTGTVSAG